MYKHINSASRIHTILLTAISQQDKATWAVWADVFGVKGASDHETAELVIGHLYWLQTELKLLVSQAEAAGLSKHLYEHSFSRVRTAISALNLPVGWKQVANTLSADVLLALAFLNELLPDEESCISPEELLAIKAQLEELEEMLRGSQLPVALKKLIAHHLLLIRQALAQYKIFGAQVFREAARTALGEIIELKDVVEESKRSEEVGRLQKLWSTVNAAADTALKAEKLGQLAHKAWDTVAPYF